jgi:phosphoribosylglycinamide formyltransferase-1
MRNPDNDRAENKMEQSNRLANQINTLENQPVKISVLVSGGGSNLQSVIDHIKSGFLDRAIIVQVVSSSADAYALERAKNEGIPGSAVTRQQWPEEEKRNEEILRLLKEAGTDLIVLAGYMSILSPELISAYGDRIINIHPSLIPRHCGKGYYGKRVHRSVLEAGDLKTGATVHYVDEGIDTGRIILQETVPVEPGDTEDSLAARVLAVEHKILPQAIKLFCEEYFK